MTIPTNPSWLFSPRLIPGLLGLSAVLTWAQNMTAVIYGSLRFALSFLWSTSPAHPGIFTRWATEVFYYLHVGTLTVIAYLTGRSFIILRGNNLPRFIARPGNQDLRPFPLNLALIFEIYIITGNAPVCPASRSWRTGPRVQARLNGLPLFNVPPLPTIPLPPRTLVGKYVTQEQGLIGHGYCLAILEEYGEGPGGQIMCRAYSWTHGHAVNVGIPRSFFPSPDVDENDGFHLGSPTLEEICFTDPFESIASQTLFKHSYPAIFAPPEDDNDGTTVAEEDQSSDDSKESDDDEWADCGARAYARLWEKKGTLAALDPAHLV